MKVAIIEDEPINANELISLIEQFDPGINIDPVMDTIENAINYFQKEKPELLFLDIELADGNCFDIFQHVTVNCPIVFTTAYDEYVMKAFEQSSISYLLKPVTFEKLCTVFEKLDSMKLVFKEEIDRIQKIGSPYKENFLVRSGKKLIPVSSDQIQCFYSTDHITYIMSDDGRKFLFDKHLYELEVMLDPQQFFRANRQYIVNRKAVSHLESYVKGQVKLFLKGHDGAPIFVSRQKTPMVKEWLS